jgi:flagellar motor switch protein FliM
LNKLLSQDEVDALLKGIDTGDIEADESPEGRGRDLDAYDWTSQGSNIMSTMPLLDVVNTRYSQRFRNALSSVLRKMVDISSDPIETTKFKDFQKSLPIPTSMHLFKIEPLRGMGILVIESRLVFSLVEALFGGTGQGETHIAGRDFTPIENKIVEKVVQVALVSFMESWQDVHPIKTEFVRSESNPLVVNMISGEEVLMSSHFEVELKRPLGSMTICLPVSSFQPIRHKLAGGYREEEDDVDQLWVSQLTDRLLRTELEMGVTLGRAELSVRELLNLKKGDIVLLENNYKHPIRASIGGIPKYEGFVGRYNNKKVFKVEQPIRPGT